MVFERESSCGNGRVTVTAHAASPAEDCGGSGPGRPGLGATSKQQQWRVLRFNAITRQSVARVALQRMEGGAVEGPGEGWRLQAQPDCLAADYLKTVASAGGRPCISLRQTLFCGASVSMHGKAHTSQCHSQLLTSSVLSTCVLRQHVKAGHFGCGSGGSGGCLASEATTALHCRQQRRCCLPGRAA